MTEPLDARRPFALLTFSPMIDSEACRFVLNHHRKSYTEEPHLFGWASLLALWHGWTIQIPVLYGGGLRLAGPLGLATHFDKDCAPEHRLMPADKRLLDQATGDWTRFNKTLGTAVAVFAYYHLLARRDLMFEPLTRGGPAYETSFVKWSYPAFAGMFHLLLRLNADHARRSLDIIRATFGETDTLLADGRRYLTGEQFTLSDIALATSAAPILLPDGFASPMPSFDVMPAEMKAAISEMRRHDTARFVERIYRDHGRGRIAAQGARATGWPSV